MSFAQTAGEIVRKTARGLDFRRRSSCWCPDREIRLVLRLARNEFRDLKDTSQLSDSSVIQIEKSA
jgi:hypothetical protein